MRRALISVVFVSLVVTGTLAHLSKAAAHSQQAQPQKPAPPQNPPQQTPTPSATPQPQAAPTAQPTAGLHTVVIDPGHGGTDTGARGPSGLAEKDIVLQFAQEAASALRAQGFEVVMTRFGDTDPSLDDRATVANAQTSAVFISLHVGSTGPVGTVRTYTYLFPTAASGGAAAETETAAETPPGFLLWQEAQKPFLAQSVKLGDLIQVELAQKFKGSPEVSKSVPVAVLRSVAAPAVAVEISSIATDSQKLESMSSDLAAGITRAVAAYKTIYPPGGR